VTYDEGKSLASEFGIKFFETSAKLNTNVDEAFASIAKDIVDRLKKNPEHYNPDNGENITVNEQPTGTTQKSCC
jgi:Ras-related protein Rab-8A